MIVGGCDSGVVFRRAQRAGKFSRRGVAQRAFGVISRVTTTAAKAVWVVGLGTVGGGVVTATTCVADTVDIVLIDKPAYLGRTMSNGWDSRDEGNHIISETLPFDEAGEVKLIVMDFEFSRGNGAAVVIGE